MWIVCITSVRHVLTVNGYGGRQTKENEKSWCFKGWETLVMKNCYGIDFRSWRKELRTREKTKQPPCKLPDRASRSLQGVLFKVYQISVLILLKKILFSFFSVCLPLFIRHIAAMLLRKTSSKTMQTVTKYLKELSGVRSDNSPNSYK